jgi:hypothetical protein
LIGALRPMASWSSPASPMPFWKATSWRSRTAGPGPVLLDTSGER